MRFIRVCIRDLQVETVNLLREPRPHNIAAVDLGLGHHHQKENNWSRESATKQSTLFRRNVDANLPGHLAHLKRQSLLSTARRLRANSFPYFTSTNKKYYNFLHRIY
jgi:hypothetical protein